MEQRKYYGNLIAFSLLALAASVFARITGHDFGYEASLLSLGLILIFYTLRFWKKEPKRLVDFARYGVVLTWSVHALGVLHGSGFFGWTFLLLLAAALLWGAFEVKNQTEGKGSLNELHFLLLAGLVTEMLGMIFKVQHWPGANVLLVMGLAIAGSGFVFNRKAQMFRKS